MGCARNSPDDTQPVVPVRKTTDTAWESAVKDDPNFTAERQEALQDSLGLSFPEMAAFIKDSEFVSLGSHCRVAMALENMGLRKGAFPLDYVRSSAEGVLQLLETDFHDFTSFSDKKKDKYGNKYFFGTSWGGSFWHHDIEDENICKTFGRRANRFLGKDGKLAGFTDRVFVRVANTPSELVLAPKLLEKLQRKLPQVRVRLLTLIDMQKQTGLLHVQNTSRDLLFAHIHEDLWLHGSKDLLEQRHQIADTYAASIADALLYWVKNDKAAKQPAVLQDFGLLRASTMHFEGGDCKNELYNPAPKSTLTTPRATNTAPEVVYVRLPNILTGPHFKAHCFGRDFQFQVPADCGPGSQLELRLIDRSKYLVSVSRAKTLVWPA